MTEISTSSHPTLTCPTSFHVRVLLRPDYSLILRVLSQTHR